MRTGRKRSSRRAQIALGLACVSLAGVVYEELERPVLDPAANAASVPPAVRQAAPSIAAPSFTMPPLRSYAEVTARPMFTETRRPPPEVSRGPPAQPSSFTLIGVVRSESGGHALIEHGQPPRLDRVVEGQELDGWTVESIRSGKVVIRYGNTREDIKPRDRPTRTPQPRQNQRNG